MTMIIFISFLNQVEFYIVTVFLGVPPEVIVQNVQSTFFSKLFFGVILVNKILENA